MAEHTKRAALCEPLADTIYSGLKPRLNTETKTIATFFNDHVNSADKHEADNEFKRTLVLETQKSRLNQKKKANKTVRISKKQLTGREKRDLGLNRLPKTGLKYAQFKALNELWVEYMNGLLDIASLEAAGWTPGNLEESRYLQLQMKVYRADFHGSILKVESSPCGSHVGVQGICLMETKHTLQLISIDNKLRIIPKQGTAFSMQVGSFKFTLPGSSILVKPHERATKKPKNKIPLDF